MFELLGLAALRHSGPRPGADCRIPPSSLERCDRDPCRRPPELPAHGPRIEPRADSPVVDALSEREIEILSHVATGKSNREIASELYVAIGTVKAHINHVFRKLSARNRTEAVARARVDAG